MPESNAQSFRHNSHISHIKGDVWASPIFRRTRKIWFQNVSLALLKARVRFSTVDFHGTEVAPW